jgi:hypothetical protein
VVVDVVPEAEPVAVPDWLLLPIVGEVEELEDVEESGSVGVEGDVVDVLGEVVSCVERVDDEDVWLVDPLRVVDCEEVDGLVDVAPDVELLELPVLGVDWVWAEEGWLWLDVVCALSARAAAITAIALPVTDFRGIFICDFP